MINIKGLNKAEVLATLFNNSKIQGINQQLFDMGILSLPKDITTNDAQTVLDKMGKIKYFEYLDGKVMKINLTSDIEFDERLYDRDNGAGAAQEAINVLRNKIVAFCMRCFSNSSVPVDRDTNFCHNCGSEGTCIAIKKDEADYLRKNIERAVGIVGTSKNTKVDKRVGYIMDYYSKHEALKIIESLNIMKDNNEPVHFSGFGDIMISDIELIKYTDYISEERYRIRLGGILV